MRSPRISEFCYRRDEYNEDIHLVQHSPKGIVRAFVGDGVAEYHSPKKPRRIMRFEGDSLDAAQLAGKVVMRHFLESPSGLSLKNLFCEANRAVGLELEERDFPMKVAADLPGLDIAAVRFVPQEDLLEIAQCGDCLASWELADGTVAGTKNQVFALEDLRRPLAEQLRQEGVTSGNIWDDPRWEKLYREHRELYKNKPGTQYANATINGQPGFDQLLVCKSLPASEVRRLLLFTDGLVPYQETGDVPRLAKKLFKRYDEVGLNGIARDKGLENIKEATAMMFDFRE